MTWQLHVATTIELSSVLSAHVLHPHAHINRYAPQFVVTSKAGGLRHCSLLEALRAATAHCPDTLPADATTASALAAAQGAFKGPVVCFPEV